MDAFFTGFMLLRGRLGTSLLMCFSLVNYLACIPEIELFYDQVVLFQFFQRIPHGTGASLLRLTISLWVMAPPASSTERTVFDDGGRWFPCIYILHVNSVNI